MCNLYCHLAQRLIRIFEIWEAEGRGFESRTWPKFFSCLLFRLCETFLRSFGVSKWFLLSQFSALWDFSKGIFFVLNFFMFSYIRILFSFQARHFFKRLFSKLFSSKPPWFSLETKIEDSSGFWHYATYRRPSSEIFSKKFFFIFSFPEKFFCGEKWVLLSPVGKKWFSSLMRIHWGTFRHCKIDETSTKVSFYIFKP